MKLEKRNELKKQGWIYIGFWCLMGAGIFGILSRMGYSDGDDVFFHYYSTSMGFFEYLCWRYQTWVGRMAGEALVYLTFNLGLWFWRVVNAVMIVLLPAGILRLSCKAAGYKDYYEYVAKQQSSHKIFWSTLRYPVFLAAGYLLMSVMTLGYSAVWVNGSIFYTWTFTAGVWAMMPLCDIAFETGAFSKKQLIYAIPCSVIAAMSIEQMGAVLIAFEVLTILCILLRKQKMDITIIIQFIITAAAFIFLFLAPGNAIRVESEIVNWMPKYREMTFGSHFFMTVQWILSSFANESKDFFIGIWLVGILFLQEQKENSKSKAVYQAIAALFTAAALLPYAGFYGLSEMGLGGMNIEECITELPGWQSMTAQNKAAFFWWFFAVLFTLIFLWKITEHSVFISMVYLGGIASEAVLFFSPTIYASGARVYYLTDLMYLFVILWLLMRIRSEKKKNGFVIAMLVLGVVNFISQYSVMLLKL